MPSYECVPSRPTYIYAYSDLFIEHPNPKYYRSPFLWQNNICMEKHTQTTHTVLCYVMQCAAALGIQT